MDIQLDTSEPFAVARVIGELRADEAEVFTEALQELGCAENAALAIDLSGVTGIDSSGLGALVHLVARANVTHGRVVLVAPSPFVSGVLNATHLDQWFEIYDSVEDAGRRIT